MLTITIPGFGELTLENLVLDFNGTLACDGVLLPGVARRLESLASRLQIYVLTADTFGTVRQAMAQLDCQIVVLPAGDQEEAKGRFVAKLGADVTGCVGNGRNDRLMLKEAALGVAVVQTEGAAAATLRAADVVVPGIEEALDLFLRPQRLKATLRR